MKKQLIFFVLIYGMLTSCKQESNEVKTKLKNEELLNTKTESMVITKIDSSELPKSLKYSGFIKNAVRWNDNQGENILITTETGIYTNEKFEHENDGSDAELYAYHFIVKDNELFQTWQVYDYIKDCSVDIEATFVKNTLQVTDLDKNGIAEIWLMYKKVCHGDVSPSEMKVIMYEGNKKFAMRGENKVFAGIDNNGKKQFYGGEYKFDKEFKNGSRVFKNYALNLWNKNIM
ncbi:M949_RS01915 family surface polysaccharide biosynthesis protein [Flavobacterium sp. GP15]|uniref:M949_RS01915 family surface polysaccharide biosynthesis protein n=1 Tax=Flavobacterium sp. GP15 TaxID=2758567 RepID=UPI00165DF00B|nr:hypothetical protein [Flavobacterium sp. GP15]